ncbi:hypothetical protein WH50_15755 [Pokkaliibacter plantistimulans]|uniref:Uncharacterized protein n=1 Tax=Pokkaliibacter plantistimulans TaxID=1635171 RepID=A0ABX5LUR1_9GAMM|nr:hypothetical protein WH50_15755 [Pokkaliibacter plantistimulans]
MLVTERVATAKALQRQPSALERAMQLQCLHGIFRAAGGVTAVIAKQRADGIAVEQHQPLQQPQCQLSRPV